MSRPPLSALLSAALPACAWGCWSLFLRPSGLSWVETSLVVFAVMGLALLPFLRRERLRPDWSRPSLWLLLCITCCDLLNVACFFAAMQVTSVGVAVLTHYLAPVLVALIAPAVGEARVRGATACALLATVGLFLVLEPWKTPAEGLLLGALLGTSSAAGYAANVMALRRLAGRIGPVRAVSLHGLGAAALLSPFADWTALAGAAPARLVWLVLGALLLGGVAGLVFTRALQVIGSARATMLAYLEPLVAVLVGILVWGERHSLVSLVGGALILFAGLRVSMARS